MGRVVFVSCTNVGKAMIDAIYRDHSIQTEVAGIVNLNTEKGLGKANYQTYLDTAEKYHLPIFFCNNVNDRECLDWIREKKPDIIIQSGWSQKFRPELLTLPRYGCIGEHPAPLPKGRGAACINWAILTGETLWGDSFFRMVDEYDEGEVYSREFFKIEEYDNVKTVYDKVAICASRAIREHLDDWAQGEFHKIEIDEKEVTYYTRRTPQDGLFDFSMPAKTLHDFIRAQTHPYPGAFFLYRGEKIIVLDSHNPKMAFPGESGTILSRTDRGGILVLCGDGKAIELLRFESEDGSQHWFCEDDRFVPLGHIERW